MKCLRSPYPSLFLIFSLTLFLPAASADTEINITLEDNLVILLDYSGSTAPFREYIQSNAIYSVRSIGDYSNISVVFYGGFIKSSVAENRTGLEEFIRSVTGKSGDAARDNIYQGFDEAGRILNNSTGTKQIVLISDGNLDGRWNGKFNNDALIGLVKDLKKNNVTINLYQVSTTRLSPASKPASVREPYKDLGDKLNTEVVVLNPEENIRFLKLKLKTAAIPVSSLANSSQSVSPDIVIRSSAGDEYLNEFSNDGETGSVISVIQYDHKDFLSAISPYNSFSEVRFYSYCNQTCVIVPFDVEQRKFFDKKTLDDVFRSKNAIELVKSGRVTESAYTFTIGFDLCEYYGFDVLKEESVNLGGEIVPKAVPESAKGVKELKQAGVISKFNPATFVASVSCTRVLNEEGEVFSKIAEGRKYVINLRNGFAYNGIVNDFQDYNRGTIRKINEAKSSSLIKAHGLVQSVSKLFTPLIKLTHNCLNNRCQGDISMDKTNMEIFNEKLTLISDNYNQLSGKNYEKEASLALIRVDAKSKESNTYIGSAGTGFSELDSQIPFGVTEMISNFFYEPETNYTPARLKRNDADYFLKKAKENHAVYKFNSAIRNSEYSVVQAKEGMVLVNIEKSKQRHIKEWVGLLEIILLILPILIVMIRWKRSKNTGLWLIIVTFIQVYHLFYSVEWLFSLSL